MSLLSEHWSRLTGSVHPDDEAVFARFPGHTFDLRFPPPAFVGRIDAPIVILMSNGGLGKDTESEFPNEDAVRVFRDCLHGKRATLPPLLSTYYTSGRRGKLIREGKAVVVNAVPYRSPALSEEDRNSELAHHLVSLQVHRRWLVEELLPQARRGDRYVIAHRPGWWMLTAGHAAASVVVCAGAEPLRKYLSRARLSHAETWLAARTPPVT